MRLVSQDWQVSSIFWGIAASPVPVHHSREVLGADLVSQLLQLRRLWQLMMSHMMQAHV